MSRDYPRFIYSDPFIVHLLQPRMICRIDPVEDHFTINILEVFDKGTPIDDIDGVIKSMRRWAIAKTNLHIVK